MAVEEQYLEHKPTNISFAEAAAAPLASITSWQALKERAHIKEGQKVLVIGGSGGTGSVGIQLAKHFGCYVVTVCSGRNEDFVKEIGADKVVDYTKEDWGEALQGQDFDVIYDCIGGEDVWSKAPKVLKKGGQFITIAGDKQAAFSIPKVLGLVGSVINRKFWSVLSSAPKYDIFTAWPNSEHLQELAKLIEQGVVKLNVSKRFSLTQDDVLAFFEESMSSRVRGKIVLQVIPEDDNEQEKENQEEEKEEGKGKENIE